MAELCIADGVSAFLVGFCRSWCGVILGGQMLFAAESRCPWV